MAIAPETSGRLLDFVVEHLDIPRSLYEKTRDRHRSLGEWLQREESVLARFDPDVRPQGSFRFGTVIRPLRDDDEYDLDNVCVLKNLGKSTLSQRQLKEHYGREVIGYARANKMLKPVTEHHRCWRLQYSDEVEFHLDTLPCVPEDESVLLNVRGLGVEPEFALRAVAITDRRDRNYERISPLWPSSNPRGFAAWFERRAALGRTPARFSIRAMVEDVPPYEWKTTLQRSIQILKRHRDVMFSDPEVADLAPISMIITNLAARAYEGETEIWQALNNIVEKMPSFVQPTRPRVPNPADPAEDYADKWSRDPRLAKSFEDWHAAVRADLRRLSSSIEDGSVKSRARSAFKIDLSDREVRQLTPTNFGRVSVVASTAPSFHIPSAPRPWGR
jgi:hypothetical protein